MTIEKLIGTAPSQVSRNKDLGTMAFRNARTEKYPFASYGLLTMPSTNPTTATYSIKLEQPVPSSGYNEIMFRYSIAAYLYLITPTAHYSHFTGTLLCSMDAADNIWKFQKMTETVSAVNDYPYNAINSFAFTSSTSTGYNAGKLDQLTITFNSNRSGNTPGQSIRMFGCLERLASADGATLLDMG